VIPIPPDTFPPEISQARWTVVASSGYSGATIWRSDSGLSVKRWPVRVSADRLQAIHAAQRQLAPLEFVPRLIPDRFGQTVIDCDGFRADVSTWCMGQPNPGDWTFAAIDAAVQAIVETHRLWQGTMTGDRPASVVGRRLSLLAEYESRSRTVHSPLVAEIEATIGPHLIEASRRLRPCRDRPTITQTIWSDLHHDHVLFEQDRVTGLIDFGSVRDDHPGCDLARLFDDEPSLMIAMDCYEKHRPDVIDRPLTIAVRETAAVVNLAAWSGRLAERTPTEREILRLRKWLDPLRR
jgi:aminoglycoside phosphotransferase (APT) family kinase protein